MFCIYICEIHSGLYFDLPWPPLPSQSIFLVQNGLYRCPTYSITCFMFISYLWGVFLDLEVKFRGILVLSGNLFHIYKKKHKKSVFSPIKVNKMCWFLRYELIFMSLITVQNLANGCFRSQTSCSREGCLASVFNNFCQNLGKACCSLFVSCYCRQVI